MAPCTWRVQRGRSMETERGSVVAGGGRGGRRWLGDTASFRGDGAGGVRGGLYHANTRKPTGSARGDRTGWGSRRRSSPGLCVGPAGRGASGETASWLGVPSHFQRPCPAFPAGSPLFPLGGVQREIIQRLQPPQARKSGESVGPNLCPCSLSPPVPHLASEVSGPHHSQAHGRRGLLSYF